MASQALGQAGQMLAETGLANCEPVNLLPESYPHVATPHAQKESSPCDRPHRPDKPLSRPLRDRIRLRRARPDSVSWPLRLPARGSVALQSWQALQGRRRTAGEPAGFPMVLYIPDTRSFTATLEASGCLRSLAVCVLEFLSVESRGPSTTSDVLLQSVCSERNQPDNQS